MPDTVLSIYSFTVLIHAEIRDYVLTQFHIKTSTSQRKQYVAVFKARALELNGLGSKLGSFPTVGDLWHVIQSP